MIAVDLDRNSEVILRGTSFPLCVDWLPDGHLLVVSARDGLLLRREDDGSLVTHGDLTAASDPPTVNKLVVDGRGNAYVKGGGFNMMAGEEFAPGVIALVAPDDSARHVAGGLAFPNGMLVLPDSSTLIVAESYSATPSTSVPASPEAPRASGRSATGSTPSTTGAPSAAPSRS